MIDIPQSPMNLIEFLLFGLGVTSSRTQVPKVVTLDTGSTYDATTRMLMNGIGLYRTAER